MMQGRQAGRTHDRYMVAAAVKRVRLVALAAVAALVCLSLRVVRLPERETERLALPATPAGRAPVVVLPPVVVTSR